MKILIDENLLRKLAAYLVGHECRTVAQCGWSGKRNGELLALADPLFDLLLTLDKTFPISRTSIPTELRCGLCEPDPTGFRICFSSFRSVWRRLRTYKLAKLFALVRCLRVETP